METTSPSYNSRSGVGDVRVWCERWAEWIAFGLAVVCYLNVLSNDFTNDGIPIVQVSDKVNKPDQWLTIWTTDYWSGAEKDWVNRDLLYRPMAVSSYRLVRIFAGTEPWPQHLVNILLHGVASALIVRLSRRVKIASAGALVAGVIFAVLPIHSEVIANVVGRADLLATVGLLVALLMHRRLINVPNKLVLFGFAEGAAAFIAISAKESSVALVGILAFFDLYWSRERSRADSKEFALKRYISLSTASRLLWVVVPTIIYLFLRFNALGGQLHQKPAVTKTVNVLVDSPPWQHALGVVQLWGMYWMKTVWPAVLNVTYSINGIRLATSALDAYVVIGLIVTGLLLAASVRVARRGEWLVALLTVSLAIAYFPTSNAYVLLQVFFAERIWYLPSIFACLLLGFASTHVTWSGLRAMFAIALVTAMMGRCWIRTFEWKNNGTLAAASYRDAPDAIVGMFLYGQWLLTHGEPEKSIPLFERALQIDLGYTDAYRMLGLAYLAGNQYDKAVHYLQIANMNAPGHPKTMAELEYAVEQLTRASDAEITKLRSEADAKPNEVAAQLAYVGALRDIGRLQDALQRLETFDSRFSDVAQWHQEYAVILLYLNRRDEAYGRYAKAVELSPDDAQLLVEYAMLLLERREQDDLERAQQLADRASMIKPDTPFVLVCQAELDALRGNLENAIALYRKAMRLLPPESSQRPIFDKRLQALGG